MGYVTGVWPDLALADHLVHCWLAELEPCPTLPGVSAMQAGCNFCSRFATRRCGMASNVWRSHHPLPHKPIHGAAVGEEEPQCTDAMLFTVWADHGAGS